MTCSERRTFDFDLPFLPAKLFTIHHFNFSPSQAMAYAQPHRFQLVYRHPILCQFACPYQSSSPNGHCTVPLTAILGRCPFGHFGPSSHRIRPLPPYICAGSLLGCCTQLTRSNSFSDEALIRCAGGFHPDVMDLVDLNLYQTRIALTLLSYDQNGTSSVEGPSISATSNGMSSTEGNDLNDRECAICLEPILGSGRQFGLLEHCSHVFCFPCLATWHHQDPTRRCSVCRTASHRTMVWPSLPPAQEYKRALFALQRQCLYLYSMSYQRRVEHPHVDNTLGQHVPNPTLGPTTLESLLTQTESLIRSLDSLANTLVNIQQGGLSDEEGTYTDMVTENRGVDYRNLRYL